MTDEQTKDFIIMKEDIKHIKDDILDIKDALNTFIEKSEKNFTDRFSEVNKKIQDNKDEADKTFAGKWVEKIMWSVGGIIGTTIVVAILSLILK
jgi:hypothetical protein